MRTGFRANSNRSGTTPAHNWANYPDQIAAIVNRLSGVVIENRDAIKVMQQHDTTETAMHRNRCYTHELDLAEHQRLLDFLRTVKGSVVLSGYPHESYDAALSGWRRIETNALADGARDRVEVLWINPRATAAKRDGKRELFDLESAEAFT